MPYTELWVWVRLHADAAESGPPVAVAAVGISRRGGLAVLRRGVVPLLALDPIPVRGTAVLSAVCDV